MPPEALNGDSSYPHPAGTPTDSPVHSPDSQDRFGGSKRDSVVAIPDDLIVTAHWPVAEPMDPVR